MFPKISGSNLILISSTTHLVFHPGLKTNLSTNCCHRRLLVTFRRSFVDCWTVFCYFTLNLIVFWFSSIIKRLTLRY